MVFPGTWPNWRRWGNERKDRHSTDSIRWTGLSSTWKQACLLYTIEHGEGLIAYSWTRRLVWLFLAVVSVGVQSSGYTMGVRVKAMVDTFCTYYQHQCMNQRKALPSLWALTWRGAGWLDHFPHGYDAMVFDWLWPSQQHAFTQDFIHPGIPPHPTISVALIK